MLKIFSIVKYEVFVNAPHCLPSVGAHDLGEIIEETNKNDFILKPYSALALQNAKTNVYIILLYSKYL